MIREGKYLDMVRSVVAISVLRWSRNKMIARHPEGGAEGMDDNLSKVENRFEITPQKLLKLSKLYLDALLCKEAREKEQMV